MVLETRGSHVGFVFGDLKQILGKNLNINAYIFCVILILFYNNILNKIN